MTGIAKRIGQGAANAAGATGDQDSRHAEGLWVWVEGQWVCAESPMRRQQWGIDKDSVGKAALQVLGPERQRLCTVARA